MPDLLNILPDEAFRLHRMTKEMINGDNDMETITQSLTEQGISKDYAEVIIDNVLTDMRDRKDSIKLFIMGILTLIVAFVINSLSLRFGLIFWGLVVAGIVMMIRAVMLYRGISRY